MKKRLCLFCALLLALLSACGPAAPPEEEPLGSLHLERLRVELSRNGLPAASLVQAVRELPELLKAALAAQEVVVDEVGVSVGASPQATVQAVAAGGVDLVFLPAADFAALETPPRLILAAGPVSSDGEGNPVPGAPALICAAPTENGRALAAKADGLTWKDLSGVRWGALEEGSLVGRQALDLWLGDQYGESAAHLALSVYDSYESLLRAAAAGDIDVLPLWEGVRRDWAETWTMSTARTDERGIQGFGRPSSLAEELSVLGETERLYTAVVAVGDGSELLTDSRFADALSAALASLQAEPAAAALGPYPYGPADNEALDPQRRLANS